MDYGFYSWGLPLGRIAGIQIRLHWTLLLYWAVQYEPGAFGFWAATVLLAFGSILLHELGHCFAARAVGGDAEEVLLWPLGGLAFCRCPDFWRSHLIVAAGGPLVTAAIVLVSWFAFPLAERLSPELRDGWFFYAAQGVLLYWNLIILIFNLVPLYPMDGGRIFHACAWGFFNRQGGYVWGGHSRANRLTLQVSRVCAAAGVAYGVYTSSWHLVILFLFVWSQAEQLGRPSY